MFLKFQETQNATTASANSWTLSDLANHIDSLPNGMHWLYLTGPACKLITNNVIGVWSTCVIYKREANSIIVMIIPAETTYPVGYLAKVSSGWGTSVTFRDRPGTELTSWTGDCNSLADSLAVGENRFFHIAISLVPTMSLPNTTSRWML